MLVDLLSEKRAAVLQKWFDAVINSYPAETARFLRTQKDRFANPVGQAILEGTEGILEELFKYLGDEGRIDSGRVSGFLDSIIRVRAIQDFTPSGAVWFIFQLKEVVREEFARDLKEDPRMHAELARLEHGIDELALLSFDIFMKCREQIYHIKADEERRGLYRLLQQARIITGEAEEKNGAGGKDEKEI